MTRAEQLADAYEAVARVNHYMVGIVEPVSDDELAAAEQILIARDNSQVMSKARRKAVNLALDLIESETHRIGGLATNARRQRVRT